MLIKELIHDEVRECDVLSGKPLVVAKEAGEVIELALNVLLVLRLQLLLIYEKGLSLLNSNKDLHMHSQMQSCMPA